MKILSITTDISDQYSHYLNLLTKCGECPKMVEARQILADPKPIPPFGNPNVAKFMLVGIAPGRLPQAMKKEQYEESAFRYGSGEVLRKAFKDLELDESLFFITNIFKCNTPADSIFLEEDGNRCIKKHLAVEITMIQNLKHIVLLGRQAQQWCTKYLPHIKTPVKTVWHPSYVLRNDWDNYEEYVQQLKFLKSFI